MDEKVIFESKNALSEDDLKHWCKIHNLEFNIVNLESLSNTPYKTAFVFTGEHKDDINKGHDHHWMFIDGKLLFDSYGRERAYEIPKEFEIIENNPIQLQEFNSIVCGHYCCGAYAVLNNHPKISDPVEIGELISDTYGFTKNRRKNDLLIYNWYKKTLQKDS